MKVRQRCGIFVKVLTQLPKCGHALFSVELLEIPVTDSWWSACNVRTDMTDMISVFYISEVMAYKKRSRYDPLEYALIVWALLVAVLVLAELFSGDGLMTGELVRIAWLSLVAAAVCFITQKRRLKREKDRQRMPPK